MRDTSHREVIDDHLNNRTSDKTSSLSNKKEIEDELNHPKSRSLPSSSDKNISSKSSSSRKRRRFFSSETHAGSTSDCSTNSQYTNKVKCGEVSDAFKNGDVVVNKNESFNGADEYDDDESEFVIRRKSKRHRTRSLRGVGDSVNSSKEFIIENGDMDATTTAILLTENGDNRSCRRHKQRKEAQIFHNDIIQPRLRNRSGKVSAIYQLDYDYSDDDDIDVESPHDRLVDDSPFYVSSRSSQQRKNHVKFSSSKSVDSHRSPMRPSSSGGRVLRSSYGRSGEPTTIRIQPTRYRTRNANLEIPADDEDEENEFHRKYSRDIRTRKRNEARAKDEAEHIHHRKNLHSTNLNKSDTQRDEHETSDDENNETTRDAGLKSNDKAEVSSMENTNDSKLENKDEGETQMKSDSEDEKLKVSNNINGENNVVIESASLCGKTRRSSRLHPEHDESLLKGSQSVDHKSSVESGHHNSSDEDESILQNHQKRREEQQRQKKVEKWRVGDDKDTEQTNDGGGREEMNDHTTFIGNGTTSEDNTRDSLLPQPATTGVMTRRSSQRYAQSVTNSADMSEEDEDGRDEHSDNSNHGEDGRGRRTKSTRKYFMRQNRDKKIVRYGENSDGGGRSNRHGRSPSPQPTMGESRRRPSKSFGLRTERKSTSRREGEGGVEVNSSSASDTSDDSDDPTKKGDASSRDEKYFQKRKAKRMNIERSKLMPLNLSRQDLQMSKFKERQKVGASLADVSPMEMDSNVTFDSVGGSTSHVNSLKEIVMFPLLYPEIFSKFQIQPPRGVLFYGPPGTGKTLIARALANECSKDGKKVAFFMRKGADCLSKWIGESERQLRLLFDQAFQMRPSIIFFDEIDGLAPVRSSRQDQIHSSIVSTLLALMDGLDNRGEVIVIGATNRIENIDPALRRPGRFDRELRFELPTRSARLDILSIHTKEWNPPLPVETLEMLAEKSIGYCGADLKGLCAESALNCLRRTYPQVYKSNKKLAIDVNRLNIVKADFESAMKLIVPSTHRVSEQLRSPLTHSIRPLLASTLKKLCGKIDDILGHNPLTDHYECHRPRLLLTARDPSSGLNTYVAPAVLHHLEKWPVYTLNAKCLMANVSSKSPEESLIHVVTECCKNVPAVLYLPYIDVTWEMMSDTLRLMLQTLLKDVMPDKAMFVFATSTSNDFPKEENFLIPFDSETETFEMGLPSETEIFEYFRDVFDVALSDVVTVVNASDELLVEELEQDNTEIRKLNDRELKRLEKQEKKILRELRIFLREIWGKINREQKFFMFREPVDTVEVYDYLDIIKHPMDFEKMLTKLDNNEYSSAKDFLSDIDLIVDNAIVYNSDLNYETNKIICHRSKALQDFSYALVKAEMDSDFEDECQMVSSRRKRLQEEQQTIINKAEKVDIEKSEETNLMKDNKTPQTSHNSMKSSSHNGNKSSHPHHKRASSAWSRGIVPKRSKSNNSHHPSSPFISVESLQQNKSEENYRGVEVNGNHNGHVYDKSHVQPPHDSMIDETTQDSAINSQVTDESSRESLSSHTTTGVVVAAPLNNSLPQISSSSNTSKDESSNNCHKIEIDYEKLNSLHSNLSLISGGMWAEQLQKVKSKLMKIVSTYLSTSIRHELLKSVETYINSLEDDF